MGLLAAALAASPVGAQAQILDLVYERTVMSAANERCGLFTPDVSAALAAAQVQARGAALRGGASLAKLRTTEQKARENAAAIDCASQDVTTAANRVRIAFAGFARIERINYPGELAAWRADRTETRAIRWRLAQEVRFGSDQMTFGLAGRQTPGVLLAVARFDDGQAPYSARLLMRDDRRSDTPYLGGPIRSEQGLPLARRLAPRAALRTFAAEARTTAGLDLLPKQSGAGWAFRFPSEASAELARLDPRESVAIEFLFAGDVVRRAYVEVGDFAAGRAFLSLGKP
jgi:hypothetical protein